MVKNNDLVATRHVEREASFFIQHVSFQRAIAHQLHFLFKDFSLLSELVQPCLPLGDLAVEFLGCPQTVAAMNGMIAEIGKEGDRQ